MAIATLAAAGAGALLVSFARNGRGTPAELSAEILAASEKLTGPVRGVHIELTVSMTGL